MSTLVCPNCGSTDLATIEDLSGSAHCKAVLDPDTGARSVEYDGWTEVHWDSSTSMGIECRSCGWEQEAAQDGPALNELEVADYDDA